MAIVLLFSLFLQSGTVTAAEPSCLNKNVVERFHEKVDAVCRARRCEKLGSFEQCKSSLGLEGMGAIVAGGTAANVGKSIRSQAYRPCLNSSFDKMGWEAIADLAIPKAEAAMCFSEQARQKALLENLKKETEALLKEQQKHTLRFYTDSNPHWGNDLKRLGYSMDEVEKAIANKDFKNVAQLQRRIGEIEDELRRKYEIGKPGEVKQFKALMNEHLAARQNYGRLSQQIIDIEKQMKEVGSKAMRQHEFARVLEKFQPTSYQMSAAFRSEFRSAMAQGPSRGIPYRAFLGHSTARVIGAYGARVGLGLGLSIVSLASYAGDNCESGNIKATGLYDDNACQYKESLDDQADYLCDLSPQELENYVRQFPTQGCNWFEDKYSRQYGFKVECLPDSTKVTTVNGETYETKFSGDGSGSEIKIIDFTLKDGRKAQARFNTGEISDVLWKTGVKVPNQNTDIHGGLHYNMMSVVESLGCCGRTSTKVDDQTCNRYFGNTAAPPPLSAPKTTQ